MKKELLRLTEIILLFFSLSTILSAQKETLHLNEMGQLKTTLGDKYTSTTHLTITGKLNKQDLKDAGLMANLEELDLSGATLFNDDGSSPSNFPEYSFSYTKKLKKVAFPQGIKNIERNAFYKSEGLEKVLLQEGIESIQQAAFMSCIKLKEINFPKTLKKIGKNSFYKTWELTTFEAPENLEEVGETAFYNSGIKKASINEHLSAIGAGAFGGCLFLSEYEVNPKNKYFKADAVDKALYSFDGSMLVAYPPASPATTYKNPTGVTSLASSAFEGAVHLETVRLGGTIRILPKSLFFGCKNLTKVYVGESVDSIGIGIFDNCLKLAEFHIRAVNVPRCADQPFCVFNCPNKVVLYAPAASVENYRASYVFGKVFLDFLVDTDEDDIDPTQDLVLLQEDFEKEPEQTKEWEGNENITPEKGSYIRITKGGNKVLRLGDNEGDGLIKTRELDLSGNDGNFRVRFDFDGWNDLVRTVWVDLIDGENVLGSQRISVYKPQMGETLRTFDIPFSRGTQKSRLVFRTDATQRIAILDNIKIYTTTTPFATYSTDKENIDFGKCIQGQLPPKQTLTLSLKNNNKRPSIKLLTEDLGIFDVHVDWKNDELATISVTLDATTLGEYKAFLRISLNDVNVLMIPITASVIDKNNPLDLDDSHPKTTLDEDFEKYTTGKIPEGWKIITPEGSRSWSVRKDMEGNRCMAINALETDGTVRSWLVLPALDADKLKKHNLKLLLTAEKPNGAKLKLISIDKKTGNTSVLSDLTQQGEMKWKEISFPLKNLSGVIFLALEYSGINTPTEKRTTIYRVDKVQLEEDTSIASIISSPLEVRKQGDVWYLKASVAFSVFDVQGYCWAHSIAGEEVSISPSGNNVYFVQMGSDTVKIILQ